jgi:hypothetical protein
MVNMHLGCAFLDKFLIDYYWKNNEISRVWERPILKKRNRLSGINLSYDNVIRSLTIK